EPVSRPTAGTGREPRGTRGDARAPWVLVALVAVFAALFAVWVLKHLSYPLLWNDEAETAMYGERILEFGYPKVDDGRNLIFELQGSLEVGVKEQLDAYIGSTWGQYYVGALGALAARGVDDVYAKTLRLRLPFALAGLAGVFLFAVLGAALFRGSARWLFALVFLALAPLSTVLVLHLREMRHYPLVVLLVAGALLAYVRFEVLGRGRFAVYCVLLAVLLTLLFHVFSLPYAALAATLGLHQLGVFVRGRDFGRAGAARLARGLLPVALSALALVPALVFFETFRLAGALGRAVRGGPPFGPAEHLALIVGYLERQELLLPALATRVLALAARRFAPDLALDPDVAARRSVAALLWLFVAVYVAICSLMPFSYERYLVVLSPALVTVLLFDAADLTATARRRLAERGRRLVAPAAAAAGLALLLALVPSRAPALRGRWHEITVRYRGPLDFAVEALRARYPQTDALVIATNYEPSALVYYLGSRVTVGFSCARVAEDLAVQPDVIIMRPWPRCARVLERLAAQAAYEPERLPVANTRFNNVPQLGPSPFVPETHRFETPLARDERDALVLLHRRVDVAHPGAAEGGW
ncbi:MAG TPA: hypothetical protein VHQ66_06150, partial [Myxococcota bacterium]|nr:hypothetical protein [Myxococcota bacterium]